MEFSIINFSELESIALRLDSEYYSPSNLELFNKLRYSKFKRIKDIAYTTDGIHEPINFNYDSKIRLISAKAPKENYFDLSGLKNISEKQNRNNPRTQLLENDIIISSVGTIGNCAVVDKEMLPANADRHVGIVRLRDNNFRPRFISTFLLSKYGRFQSFRECTGNVQLNLFVYKINEIIIPELDIEFQKLIETTIKLSFVGTQQSTELFQQAQDLLLSELGLTNWRPKHQLAFIKNYSDAERAGRIDAEYYQPKYEKIIKAIKNYSGGWDTLNELVTLKNKNFNPTDKKQYRYIELSNIAGNGEVSSCMLEEGQYLPTRARRKVAAGDVIVSSIEGSLSSIALIEKKYNQSLCSTGFHVVNSKQFNSETLLVLLKSIVGQPQLKKGCNGTILTAINNEEFKKIILPKVDEAKQTQIQQKVAESFRLRQQSKELLESAKKAVDIAIEQDEQVAIKWLKNETRKI